MSSDNPILRAITMLQDYKGDLARRDFPDNDEGDHLQRVNENKRASVDAAIRALRDRSNYDTILDALRHQGLSIDGDNAYKRDLLDSVVGAMAFGYQNTNPPPAGHWGQQFWDIGRAEGEKQSTSVAMPVGLHPDTQDLVTRFATALAVKLHAAELKHGYSDGWKDPNWMDECRQKLIEHLAKGDPRDVAAYCAFLWHHCQSTSPAVPDGYAVVPKRMELLPEDIAVIMYHCGGDPDATEVDEQYSGGILWIGEVQEDDGRLVHGLNIASAECPEEGSTTLVELATAPAPAKAQQEQQP